MKVNYEKEKWEAFLGDRECTKKMKGKRKCPDLQVETSLLEDWQVTKRRKISLESLYGGRKDFILEPRSDIQHCSEWETILKGWKSGAQLVIEFQNQGISTLEYIPWEGGKEDSAGQEHSQLSPTSHNTKTGSRIAKTTDHDGERC